MTYMSPVEMNGTSRLDDPAAYLDTVESDADQDELDPTNVGMLTSVSGVGRPKAHALIDAGYTSVRTLEEADQAELAEVDGIGNALAARIKADVGGIDD